MRNFCHFSVLDLPMRFRIICKNIVFTTSRVNISDDRLHQMSRYPCSSPAQYDHKGDFGDPARDAHHGF